VERFKLLNVDQDKADAIARISAVINYQKNGIGANIVPLLDALLVYAGTLSNLIQRQEHGGQKEGSTLTWEDGRRIVFQLANVMIEVDRSISTASKKA
jgi:hypothetical protein